MLVHQLGELLRVPGLGKKRQAGKLRLQLRQFRVTAAHDERDALRLQRLDDRKRQFAVEVEIEDGTVQIRGRHRLEGLRNATERSDHTHTLLGQVIFNVHREEHVVFQDQNFHDAAASLLSPLGLPPVAFPDKQTTTIYLFLLQEISR